jgi:hypothetical protein
MSMVDYSSQFHLLIIRNLREICALAGHACSVDPKVHLKTVTEEQYKQQLKTLSTPNVQVEWLELLIRIREVPGSNLGSDAFRDFPQLLQENAGIVS